MDETPFLLHHIWGDKTAEDFWLPIHGILIAWCFLIFVPRWKWTPTVALLPPLINATIHCLATVAFNVHGGGAQPDVTTLTGVVEMFQDPNVVFIGWIHYGVFDCLVGRMIVLDSLDRGAGTVFHIAVVVPCLCLTFLLGPTGFLLYMVLRTVLLSGNARTNGTNDGAKVKFL